MEGDDVILAMTSPIKNEHGYHATWVGYQSAPRFRRQLSQDSIYTSLDHYETRTSSVVVSCWSTFFSFLDIPHEVSTYTSTGGTAEFRDVPCFMIGGLRFVPLGSVDLARCGPQYVGMAPYNRMRRIISGEDPVRTTEINAIENAGKAVSEFGVDPNDFDDDGAMVAMAFEFQRLTEIGTLFGLPVLGRNVDRVPIFAYSFQFGYSYQMMIKSCDHCQSIAVTNNLYCRKCGKGNRADSKIIFEAAAAVEREMELGLPFNLLCSWN
jgi:hypothetical protein